MPDENIKSEKIRNILTPDVQVCGACREKYKEQASCSICGINMLIPSYTGMVYECPLCNNLYCENCWGNLEPSSEHEHLRAEEHAEEKSGGIFSR